jgi:phage regulator Rha-like protein
MLPVRNTVSFLTMQKRTAVAAVGQLPVPVELIERRIYLIRGQKVMLSPDLAELYQVETRALVQAVKRNLDRFPVDFMFQLSPNEYENLKSQFVISSWGGARRAAPYAFTEHGVAMLSSVLRSQRAVQMNILIIRAFVKLREMLATHKDLAARMEKLEATQKKHASVITILAEEIDQLKKLPGPPPKRRIGFTAD